MSLAWELAAVGVLILLNAFFVAAEYALVTVRRTRMHELSHDGNKRAKLVLRILEPPPHLIAAMQPGVTLRSLAIASAGEPALERAFDPVMATLLAAILGFFIIT